MYSIYFLDFINVNLDIIYDQKMTSLIRARQAKEKVIGTEYEDLQTDRGKRAVDERKP